MKQLGGTFDKAMRQNFKDDVILEQGKLPTLDHYPDFAEDKELVEELQRVFRDEDIVEDEDEFGPDSFDTHINMWVALDQGQNHTHPAIATNILRY